MSRRVRLTLALAACCLCMSGCSITLHGGHVGIWHGFYWMHGHCH